MTETRHRHFLTIDIPRKLSNEDIEKAFMNIFGFCADQGWISADEANAVRFVAFRLDEDHTVLMLYFVDEVKKEAKPLPESPSEPEDQSEYVEIPSEGFDPSILKNHKN